MSSKNCILKKKVGNTVFDINPQSIASLIGITPVTVDSITYTDLQTLLTSLLSRVSQLETDIQACSPANIQAIETSISDINTALGAAVTETTGSSILTQFNAIKSTLTITSS
jgi:hypothetical protein